MIAPLIVRAAISRGLPLLPAIILSLMALAAILFLIALAAIALCLIRSPAMFLSMIGLSLPLGIAPMIIEIVDT